MAEGRIGNNNGSTGTWEQGLWEFGGVGTPKAQGGTTWTSGTSKAFSFSYDGATTATFTQDGQTLVWNAIAGTFTDIFIRTRSARSDTRIEMTNLTLSGYGALGVDLVSSGANGVDYIRISSSTPFGAVSISGDVMLSWSGTPATNSAHAYQVKFSNVIPSPSAAVVMAVPLLFPRRRR